MNKIIWSVGVGIALVVLIGTSVANAQEGQAGQSAQAAKLAQIPLKVQIVLSRYQGDKKISSFPYHLYVTTNERTTNLRMGLQVPVTSTTFGPVGQGGVNTVPITSYTLRDVATDIDCSATPGVQSGVYKLSVTVTDTSVLPNAGQKGETAAPAGFPTFRSFTSNFVILLRDGQTAQYTSATDPVTGEVLKIDASLTVLK